jgi:hypothetical protein
LKYYLILGPVSSDEAIGDQVSDVVLLPVVKVGPSRKRAIDLMKIKQKYKLKSWKNCLYIDIKIFCYRMLDLTPENRNCHSAIFQVLKQQKIEIDDVLLPL